MRHAEYVDPRPRYEIPQDKPHEKSLAVMIMLEFTLGVCQIFGVGHIYAGNWKMGVSIMTTYWFACMANAILVPFAIGLFTWPLTWLFFMAVTIEEAIAFARATPERFD